MPVLLRKCFFLGQDIRQIRVTFLTGNIWRCDWEQVFWCESLVSVGEMRAGGCIWDPWHNRGCRTMRRAHFAMAATTTIHCTIHNVKGLQHNWHYAVVQGRIVWDLLCIPGVDCGGWCPTVVCGLLHTVLYSLPCIFLIRHLGCHIHWRGTPSH